MRNRRAALEGLGRLLDASGLEELFSGPDDEAVFLHDLLVEAARGRSSTYYWEICRTARRRGVSPEFVVDRAAVLVASMEERRRTDLYRILGVPPLSSSEMLRRRWIEFAKTGHPDMGGEATRFRQVKEAYDILRDPDRRAEYERFWVRALGPIERVVPADESAQLVSRQPVPQEAVERRVVMVLKKTPVPTPPPPPERSPDELPLPVLQASARLFAAREALDRRIGTFAPGGGIGLGGLLSRVEAALAPVSYEELEALRTEVERGIGRLETVRAELHTIADLKRALSA